MVFNQISNFNKLHAKHDDLVNFIYPKKINLMFRTYKFARTNYCSDSLQASSSKLYKTSNRFLQACLFLIQQNTKVET